ncbi:MAG: hypothetical protein FWE16_06040 [Firmicutes bacterium]|nr:hypothetical protein [Bacillota bacterium]
MEQENCEIIQMPNSDYISDEDLYLMVLGVIRLIKKHATPEQIERLINRLWP